MGNEDKILEKLVNLDIYVRENLVLKAEYRKDQEESGKTLEHIAVTVDRLDSEQMILRKDLDNHEKEIGRLKQNAGIS